MLFLLSGMLSSSTFAQNHPQDSSIAYAEKMVNTYFKSTLYMDRLRQIYDTKPLEFLMRNRKFVYAISNDIINRYVTNGFDFSTTGDVVFNYLDSVYQVGELNLRENFVEQVGTPFVPTKAAGDPCTNMDFEEGTINGWELYDGYVNSNPSQMVGATQVFAQNAQHTLMGPGVDPVVGISTVNPNGGAWSMRLGDGTGTGGYAASIKQTFLVDSNNSVFTYSYAVILEDPSGHTYGEKPFFKVNLYDQNGNQIACGEYEVVANSGLDNSFTQYSGGWYRDWTTVFAPLDSYIGQNVTIEFISGDCSQGGHYGYAYVDAECSPLEIIPPGTVICDNQPVTLSAPPGAASYSWNTGATTQNITTNQTGNYSVQVTPVQGAQCSITINAVINGVGGAPTANFTVAPTSICQGETVNVTDQSTATNNATIDQYNWDFGDGSTAVTGVTTATHPYDSAGTFNVQLIVGVQTCYDTLVKQVTVNPGPTADFTSNFVCEGTVTQFTDQSTVTNGGTITTWKWDFDSNSTIDNTTQNPTNGYANAGTYNATLIVVASGGCSDTVTKPVVVNPVPVAQYTWVDVCPGAANSFTDQSTIASGNITSWQWDMGDALGTSALQSPTYTYASTGTYNVQLTVTSDSGCIDNIVHQVTQYPNPTANFSLQDVCTGETVILTDASSGNGGTINTWGWDIQNDGTTDYSVQNTSFTYPSPGNYTVELYVETMDGCSDSTTQTITVFNGPVADYTFASVCEGNSISFTDGSTSTSGAISGWNWDFGNGATSTTQNPTQLFSAEGVYNVSLEVTTVDGCTGSTTQMVDVWPNPAPNFVVSNVCLGNSTSFVDASTVSNQFTSNTITQWSWDFGDGQGTATSQMPSYTFGLEGTYNVQLTATTNNGCVDSTVIPVTVYPNPIISFSSSLPAGCATWCVNFINASTISSGSISQYYWDFGDGNAAYDVSPSHCFANESQDVYIFSIGLIAISDLGCQSDTVISNMVTVYPNPVAEFVANPQPTTVFNTEINFTDESIGNNSYGWDFAGLGSDSVANPVFTFPDNDAGTYLVCQGVENEYGCMDTVCHDVIIDGEFTFYVPNTFTPDGDGINENFKPIFEGEDPLHYDFMVFDRWGLLIFRTDNVAKYWDGTYKGAKVQQDTYVWKVIITDKYTHKKHEYLGHVNVLR